MHKTELSLQDLPVNLDEITDLQDSSVFRLHRGNLVYQKSNYDLIQGVMIEMSLD